MAKFNNLVYRDGFMILGQKEYRVTSKDITEFMRGISTSPSEDVPLMDLGTVKVKGRLTNKSILLLNVSGRDTFSAPVSCKPSAFKDTSNLVYSLIEYLSKYV
jgi:hypothetical protein